MRWIDNYFIIVFLLIIVFFFFFLTFDNHNLSVKNISIQFILLHEHFLFILFSFWSRHDFLLIL